MASIFASVTTRRYSWLAVLMGLMLLPVSIGASEETTSDSAAQQPMPTIPALSEIDYIIAELYSAPFDRADVEPFELPRKAHEEVLAVFSPFVADSQPNLNWGETGTLRIVLRNGRCVRLSWFWYGGKTSLRFSLMGMRFRRLVDAGKPVTDDATYLDGLIRNYKEAAVNK